MKRSTLVAIAALAILCIASRGFAQTVNIAASPHNLNNDGLTINGNGTTGEICLPCHTPHGSAKNSDPNSPGELLWNHTTAWSTVYTLYTSVHSTRFGTSTSANPTLDSTSRLCLSCHDGLIAVDSYGGGTAPAGANTTAMTGIKDSMGNVGGGALGTNLSTSHPVGVGYPGITVSATGTLSYANSATKFGGSGYNDPTISGWNTPKTGSSLGGGVNFASVPNSTYAIVGCGTCHTPHTYTYKFVKVDNSGSQLCLMCHAK